MSFLVNTEQDWLFRMSALPLIIDAAGIQPKSDHSS